MSDEEKQKVIQRCPPGLGWLATKMIAQGASYEDTLGELLAAQKATEEVFAEKLLIRKYISKFSVN